MMLEATTEAGHLSVVRFTFGSTQQPQRHLQYVRIKDRDTPPQKIRVEIDGPGRVSGPPPQLRWQSVLRAVLEHPDSELYGCTRIRVVVRKREAGSMVHLSPASPAFGQEVFFLLDDDDHLQWIAYGGF
jgi:hypothetical protein